MLCKSFFGAVIRGKNKVTVGCEEGSKVAGVTSSVEKGENIEVCRQYEIILSDQRQGHTVGFETWFENGKNLIILLKKKLLYFQPCRCNQRNQESGSLS